MESGSIVSTSRAVQSWEEDTRWNGNNHISVNTGSQWEHEKLYKSSKGRYWLESWSQRDGLGSIARYLEPKKAATWLIRNKEELPEDLAQFEEDILE